GDLYHEGTAMYYVFGLIDYNIHGVERLMNYPVLYSSLTFATLFAEVALPFLLFFRATRPYAVFLGLGLHAWIMVYMTIPVFGILMVATYIGFFSEEELNQALDQFRRRFVHPGRIYFDGACPLCQRVRRVVEILDIFHWVKFVDFRVSPPPEKIPFQA